MRRKYISPEFKYVPVSGTMNMTEQTSFFGSKMIDIEDSISIQTENIIYYQSKTKEQLTFSLEKNSNPIVYNSADNKKINHIIKSDDSQSMMQHTSNTRWIVEIDIKTILSDYLFATLKKYRTFEGVKNNMTVYNNVDSAINDYITNNILSRYRYKSMNFFIDYKSFSQDNTMQYRNNFTEITDTLLITSKLQTTIDGQNTITIIFNQEKPSTSYNFNYYFNLYFEKI